MKHRTSNTHPRITSTTNSPQLPGDNGGNTEPKIIVVFTLGGPAFHRIIAETEGEQAELERRFNLISSGLDVVKAIWKQGSTGPTE